jgi:acyl-CoA synthetase (AMP-forming)/AMP-acid ligase II
MPLFHGHGLIGATLSAIFAGARVVLPDRFSASAFWPLVKTVVSPGYIQWLNGYTRIR